MFKYTITFKNQPQLKTAAAYSKFAAAFDYIFLEAMPAGYQGNIIIVNEQTRQVKEFRLTGNHIQERWPDGRYV